MSTRCLLILLLLSGHLYAIQTPKTDEGLSDSLRSIVRYSKNDTLRARAFIGLGNMRQGSMPDRAIYFYQRAIDVAEGGLAGGADDAGRLSYFKSLATAMNNLAKIYRNRGEVKLELQYSFDALKISQYWGNEQMIGRSFYSISESFLTIGDTAKCKEYLEKAIYYFTAIDDKQGLSRGYYSLGSIYMEQKDTTNGLSLFHQALKIQSMTGDEQGKATTLNALSDYYIATANYKLAFRLSRDALRINQMLRNRKGILNSLYNLAEIELNRNELTAAHRYALRGYEMAENMAYLGEMERGALLLSKVFEKQKEFKKACTYFEHYIVLHDSIAVNEERKIAVRQAIQEDYDKQRELDRIENEKSILIKQEQAENQKAFSWFAGFVGILFILLSFWAWSRFRITKLQKGIIESQHRKIVESVSYASEIQHALMPDERQLMEMFGNAFVVHQSQQIVSGDFYWCRSFQDKSVLICLDIKSQGVHGGFKSTIGALLLDKLVQEDCDDSAELIRIFNREWERHLPLENEDEVMAISVCLVQHTERVIDFAGIRNGLTIVSGNQTLRYPSTGSDEKSAQPIVNGIKQKRIELDENDWVFIYTDGFMNQTGGRAGEPMGYQAFENMLVKLTEKEQPDEKREWIIRMLEEWEKGYERSDDVLLIGIQV